MNAINFIQTYYCPRTVSSWRWTFGILFALGLIIANGKPAWAVDSTSYVTNTFVESSFALTSEGESAVLYVNTSDDAGVIRAARDLQADIERVTQTKPELTVESQPPKTQNIVIIGTLGKSPEIDQLVKSKKLDVSAIEGKWEAFLLQVVKDPMPGVNQALVIAGSDKRGTIFGIYDLSRQIGVSPWYWWADVPVKQQQNLYVIPGQHTKGEPAVKYRGIFINDEAPALSGWTQEKFGGFNHQFYEKVFELILRMKGNYLWPAMWGRAFYDDDSLNAGLANEYGIVIGTSHHEPMMRAHDEWRRYGEGAWNYRTNADSLQQFWREGVQRMGDNESIVTVGMRGDGDEPMSEGTEIALLEKIVDDQRTILEEVTGKDASETPQMWALYKEVQDYYDKGMRVPDDVTLLLCDDNWGNIRKLPEVGDTLREGGYGIYYHFDYVGGPRNYKWLNTNPIPKVWEQMHLAYEYGANQVWIVNVGDIKPMEYPTTFFLDYAWNPNEWPAERLPEYTQLWSEEQFGPEHADTIADMLTRYTRYNGRRKPELLSPETYSLVHYREAERIVEDYNQLAREAEELYNTLPEEQQAAFYQLVLFPIQACANLNELYVTAGKNHLYAEQGRAITNELSEKVKVLFEKDAELTRYYNEELADGKWSHMMDQTHIGYTYWQQPEQNNMPEVQTINLPEDAAMGIAIQGSAGWWPETQQKAVLPEFDKFQQPRYYIDIFNRGQSSFEFIASASEPWVELSTEKGEIEKEERVWVTINWQQVPEGDHQVPITINGTEGSKVTVIANVHNPASPSREEIAGFVESNGYVSIEAAHYTQAVSSDSITWQQIPNMGSTLSAITPFPVTASSQSPGGDSPHLEYNIYLSDSGAVKVHAYLSPTLNFHDDEGLQYAVSIDDEEPQIINMHADSSTQTWGENVSNNISILVSEHYIEAPGKHVLKFWMVDPAVVLQKLVIDTGGVKPSYLGPPESFYQSAEAQARQP
uniref:Glycosyl hydrolase 115 family protein n=1 Tax=Roseihalotalea indica TaxID=2867963 RepID=A0AA49GR68_9BACT|nr:glycosyl hydrolase 115 family protein [Tunicatimonas sp. TK19036]